MKRTILVVDDNLDSIAIMRGILEARGFGVATATSGADALEFLRTTPADLVLLDVMMPVMSGIEVLQRIKQDPALSALPVILVTAKTQDEDLLSGLPVWCGVLHHQAVHRQTADLRHRTHSGTRGAGWLSEAA